MTQVWITKYALSTGIEQVDAEIIEQSHSTALVAWGVGISRQFAHGDDWHYSPESARKRAEEMRVKKIESLRKSIAKLEKLEF